MSLCINPHCQKSQKQIDQGQNLFCDSCGSSLLISDIYRVISKLGHGGCGITYLIDDAGEQYVLKVLHNLDPKAVELFNQEAEVLKKLDHPGIPKVDSSSPFIYRLNNRINSNHPPLNCLIMEYIQGENLYIYLQRRKFEPISEKAALRWLRQLVEILDLVHGANYFHRDIKPANIMLRNNGQLALIDFGTAREETQTYVQKQQGKQVTGIVSSGYTPYEQQDGQAETRSDFFALGRTFVFLLTGQEPANFPASISQGLQWQKSAQGYAQPLRDFIDELMRPDVEARPANTTIILQRLAQLEQELYATKTPNYPLPPVNPPLQIPQPPPTNQPLVNPFQPLTVFNALKNSQGRGIAWVFTFFCIAGYLLSLYWDLTTLIPFDLIAFITLFLWSFLPIFCVNLCVIFEEIRKINKGWLFIYIVFLRIPNFMINYFSIFLMAEPLYSPISDLTATISWVELDSEFLYILIPFFFGLFSVKLYSPLIKQISCYKNNQLDKFTTFRVRLITISLGICFGSLIYLIFHF
ncbi:serine/threonine-protein kinase [Planktothricoides raciborskii]|uniref:Serine/threonine-protein kinase n=1 Tax=Planktothricoides raciborskii GIHE-MW2 TaxID=2792601 RepID=A0AAU8JKT8_9CYAN